MTPLRSLRGRVMTRRRPLDARPLRRRSPFVLTLQHHRRCGRWSSFIPHSDDCRRHRRGCMVAGLLQVRKGLAPFNHLRIAARRTCVTARRAASTAAIPPRCSRSSTISMRCSTIASSACGRAVAKAGDLAHGLKTPLAVLAHEADRARGGRAPRSGRHDEPAGRSHAAPDRLSPRARARRRFGRDAGRTVPRSSSPPMGCRARCSACTPTAASRSTSRVAGATPCAAQREDLDEMLGNLLDNACKWATHAGRRRRLDRRRRHVVITVDDDGPGLDGVDAGGGAAARRAGR